MKLSKLITGLLLFISGIVSAQSQDSLNNYYRKYPQKALAEAERLYKEAIHNQNSIQLIHSILLKTAYTLEIDSKQYPQMIREIETYAANEKDTAAQCILYSYMGQLYLQYYQDDMYTYNSRTDLKDTIPEDINAWSGNIFKEKINHYFCSSIRPAKLLQQVPVIQYHPILLLDAATDSLRPTLYDFLCHRAINYISLLSDRERKENKDYIPESLTVLPEFLQYHILSGQNDFSSKIFLIYQDLLRFRQNAGDAEALLLADLERLEYAYNLFLYQPGADSLYASTLQQMARHYAATPMVVEIWYRQASLLMKVSQHPELRSFSSLYSRYSDEEALKQALQICEKGIQTYPHYRRINLLHQLIKKIKTPALDISYASYVYPGKEIDIKISSRNIKDLTIEISRIKMKTMDYLQNNRKQKIKGDLVWQQKYRQPATLTTRDTTIQISGLQPGLYQVCVSTPQAKKNLPGYFVCSSLFTTQQANEKKYVFHVRDAMSGKAVKGAKIYLHSNIYSRSYELLDSVLTDANGYGTLPEKGQYYEVVNSENPNGILCNNIYSHRRDFSEKSNTWLITDRKLYRPGETVYFKGITWHSSIDSIYPCQHINYKINFNNTQQKTISSQTLRTDDFGSFSGSFQIPAQTLNGTYSITTPNSYTYITVAEYKRPEFEITFENVKRSYRLGDTIQLEGMVSSFSGVPVTDNTVHYEIKTFYTRTWFPSEIETRQGTLTTNEKGEFSLTFTATPPQTANSSAGFYSYRVTASVTDSKGETQSGTTEIPVFAGKYTPVIQLPEQVDKDQAVTFHISLANFPVHETAQKAHYSIAQLKSPSTPSQYTTIKDTIIEKVILEGQLNITGKDSIRPDLKNYPSGAYMLTVDCDGSTAKNIFYLYALTDQRPPIPTYNWLVEEKTVCQPGESARILFGSSLKDVYATYEIYDRNKLLTRKQIKLSDQVVPIEIPYRKEYSRQLWFSINYIKNGKYIQDFVAIQKAEENRTLTLQTKVFRDKITPGSQEEWELTITDHQGFPVEAEVLAMMYDASLDKIMPYPIPSFSPAYINVPFYYSWFPCRKIEENNNTVVYNWIKDTVKYPIPPFIFSKLNTYTFIPREPSSPSFPSDVLYMVDSYLVADYGSEESLQLSANAIPMAKSNTMIRGYSRQADAAAGGILAETAAFPAVDFRQNFNATAFFYPQLKTDSSGNVHLKFKVPEANTRWKFYAMASTRRLFTGNMERYITTSKELMVRPNLPRFFRNGDQAEIKMTVSNLSEAIQKGEAIFELFLPSNDSVFIRRKANFSIPAGESHTVSFSFDIPQNISLAGCRLSAQTPAYSDGEQHLIPILPDEIMVTQTRQIYASTPGTHTFSLENLPPTRQDYRLTFELSANPVWYAVLSLPALSEPQYESVTDIAASFYANTISARIAQANPEIGKAIRIWKNSQDKTTLLSQLEQNAELKSILLEASPWTLEAQNETERMQSLSGLFDKNRLEYLQHTALQKLQELQTQTGGWSWFKGMYSSHFMTCNVLTILARANSNGETEYGEQTKRMQIKALSYLDDAIQENFKHKTARISYEQLLYLYTRSMYRDIPLGDALEAHKYYLSLIPQQWDRFSLYEKAIAAMTLHRYGIANIPVQILESLEQYAVRNSGEGMYWPSNRNSYYQNNAVQTHVAIMEAFVEIKGNIPQINEMKQWLLLQKQTQSWASVPATVDAIYALLLTGSDMLSNNEHPDIVLGKQPLQMPTDQNPLGYLKKTYEAEQIHKDMFTVKITKHTDTPSWGGLYLQYFEKLDQIRPSQSGLQISKELFIEQENATGKNLLPIGKKTLKTGDKIIVRLTFSLNRDMEFLVLKDLRAACFEPIKQISGNQWKFGSVYYEDVKDAVTNFFFNSLAKGTYVIEYGVYVNQDGEYQDGIATFQSMYAPEFNAFSKATQVRVNH